jgi:aminodeoxyfutalosine synthase
MTVSDAELASLATGHDIITLGIAADEARRRRTLTFVRVADVDGAGADADRTRHRRARCGSSGSESREAAVRRVREVAAGASGKALSGFSLADLEQLAARERITLRELLEDLAAAGLELVAEAPFDRLRDPKRAIEEVNIGGLRLARLTIHQLPTDDTVALYKRIVALQYEVGVIAAFAPLPRAVNPAVPTTGYDDVRRIALARLFLSDVPSIQVDWTLYGPKLAQVALTVGANDIDAVSAVDDLSEKLDEAEGIEEVRRNVRAAGLEPVERDGRFDPRP